MQRRCLLLCGLILGTLAVPARADVGLFPRFDLDLHVCLENLDDYPEYDFYLKYGLSRGSPFASLRATEMKSGVMTKLKGQGDRFTGAYLLAVPRGTPIPQPEQNNGDWLTTVPNGAMQSAWIHDISESMGGSETTYRVHIEGNHLCVDYVSSSSLGSRICWAICGFLVSVVVLLIVFVVVKERRRRAYAAAKPAA